MPQFRETLVATVEDFLEARKDGKICAHEVFECIANTCRVIETTAVSLVGDNAAFDNLKADVGWLVREYVIPIDLTKYKVPAFIEKYILDPQLPVLVEAFMESIRPGPHGPNE